MLLRTILLFTLFSIILTLIQSLPHEDVKYGMNYHTIDDMYIRPRFRRDPMSFSDQNAYLQQLLQNLKPRFKRNIWLVSLVIIPFCLIDNYCSTTAFQIFGPQFKWFTFLLHYPTKFWNIN
uniref:Uncharacterized protein n=1 Tax=Heterorhabditis bacteriophora TaxID=37862 RepID=A0A1I7XRU1_HETBA